MPATSKKNKTPQNRARIVDNKRARFDYTIEKELECGIVLQGWEVKSLRAGKAQLVDSHVRIRREETWLIGAHITPLATASTHIIPDPTRSRKLLLHKKEISQLAGQVERKGMTIVPIALYWKKGNCKVTIGLARGKKLHDKRQTIKEREWKRDKQREFKHLIKG